MAQRTSPATETMPRPVALTALHPAPWNPRTIRDARFKNLCDSIQADPDFLWQRPILADAAGEIFAGNMRYRAVQHLGWQEVPAIISEVAPRLAKERAMRDNNQWGDIVDQDLAELLVGLQMDGSDLKLLGFPDDELTRLLESVGALGDTPAEVPFSDFPPVQASDAYVAFRFGDYSGQVDRAVYETFVAHYQQRQRDDGAVMLDDVLRGWLGVH